MGKKYMAILIVLFVVLAGFAACQKAYKHGIIITDNEGKTRVLATDKQGKTMTDDAGNLIVLVTEKGGKPATDKDGNQETQKVSPPKYYALGDTIEGAKFSVVIPDGWEKSRAGDIRLTQIKTGGELNLMVKDGETYDEVLDSVISFLDNAKVKDPDAEYKVSTVKLFDVDVKKYHYKSTQFGAEMNFYIFEKNKTEFLFSTVVKNEYTSSVNFEAVMNTIKFK